MRHPKTEEKLTSTLREIEIDLKNLDNKIQFTVPAKLWLKM